MNREIKKLVQIKKLLFVKKNSCYKDRGTLTTLHGRNMALNNELISLLLYNLKLGSYFKQLFN